MLTLPPTVRVYVSVAPVDMRKSFDGLSIAVTSILDLDPTSGHLFCFFNAAPTKFASCSGIAPAIASTPSVSRAVILLSPPS